MGFAPRCCKKAYHVAEVFANTTAERMTEMGAFACVRRRVAPRR
jgi:hypothetical protein